MEAADLNFHVKIGAIQHEPSDLIVINLFEDVRQPGGATGAVDQALGGQISTLIAAGDFHGRANETAVLYSVGAIPAKRILLVGLGKREKFNLDRVRQAAGTAARRARDLGVSRYTTIVHGAGAGGLDLQDAAQALVEGTVLGLYRFLAYKTELEAADRLEVTEVTLMVFQTVDQEAVTRGAQIGRAIATSTWLARDLINEPANVITPTRLADLARSLAAEHSLAVDVLDRQQMEGLGMGALLAVAQGSQQPPQFIVLQRNAGRQDLPTLVVIGKGITFDSGGLDLKPGDNMEKMKGDMAGAAAVLGILRATALLALPLHVVGLIPATENMPGSGAVRPGDVVHSLSGKTIEILNTDAEGRLVLADALAYATRFKPAAVVDLATLTGSIWVALGDQAAGVMTPDDGLAARLVAAGEATGERVWRLPLYEEYGEQIKSDIADVKNVGGRPAGAITGAKFLEKFAGAYPWAHLDIYGTHWTDKEKPYLAKGATGYGVRLIVQFLRNWKS
jgi:leucyl aminopeptidase